MSDILKISTPLVDRNQTSIGQRPAVESTVPFDLSDVSKVISTLDPSDILQQNTGFIAGEEAPKILTDLLKDPAVTVSMIRNLYLLQEVIKLFPATNTALTEEIQNLFDSLLLDTTDIVPELLRQEQNTTEFKGDFFDLLRSVLIQNPENQEIAAGIGMLLKALNATVAQSDALQSVSNNLTFLSEALYASTQLSSKLDNLARALLTPEASKNFSVLKDEILTVLKEVENSVLFTPQMEKTIPLIVYNLSRYNTNEDFLPDALRLLHTALDDPALKEAITLELEKYLDQHIYADYSFASQTPKEESHVMDVIAKILGRQVAGDELHLVSSESIEKIVHSLLSSPSNFTPLLHFIIPVEYMDVRAFGELWIDPNAGDNKSKEQSDMADTSHVLAVFDVEEIGRFEVELFIENKRIAMNLLCPPPYLDFFKQIDKPIRKAVAQTEYSFEAINIDELERTHSLMEVFTELPYKRMGIDVRI